MNQKKKRDIIFAITTLLTILVIVVLSIKFIFNKQSNKEQIPSGLTDKQIEELNCLCNYYKLGNNVTFYDYPNDPYIYWKGHKVYLRQKGVCE